MSYIIEKKLYKLGWLLMGAGGMLWLLLPRLSVPRLPCMLYYYTGNYCPGCGGTRAVSALLRGHLLQSFYYHPFVPYCALLFAWFMLSHTIQLLSHNRIPLGIKFRPMYLYIGLAIILLNWVVRNLFIPI